MQDDPTAIDGGSRDKILVSRHSTQKPPITGLLDRRHSLPYGLFNAQVHQGRQPLLFLCVDFYRLDGATSRVERPKTHIR